MSKEEILEKDLKIETEDKDVDEASKNISEEDKSIVLKDLKNIFDEVFHMICLNSETANDLINLWLPNVLKPEFKLTDVRVHLPDMYYDEVNKSPKVGKVENDVTLVSSILESGIVLEGDIEGTKTWKEKLFFVIEAQSRFSYNMPYRLCHYMGLTMLSRISYVAGLKKHSSVLSKRKFEEVREQLPIVVPVWINQDLKHKPGDGYGLKATEKSGVYIGSFKEFMGKDYSRFTMNVYDFKFVYINLTELKLEYASTKELSDWISAYVESRDNKELREKLERGGEMTQAMKLYREGIVAGRNEGISIGRNEGISIGEARGVSLGRSEGLREGEQNAIVTMVGNMKKSGFDFRDIMKVTGLSLKEIEAIE